MPHFIPPDCQNLLKGMIEVKSDKRLTVSVEEIDSPNQPVYSVLFSHLGFAFIYITAVKIRRSTRKIRLYCHTFGTPPLEDTAVLCLRGKPQDMILSNNNE